jgi:hypothetical protein
MGPSRRCVPRILAHHHSQSRRRHFLVVGVVVGVIVIVLANANTAAQGRRGCWLAIVAAVLHLIVMIVIHISAIAIAWDDDDELPIVLLHLVQFFYVWGELARSYLPSHSRHAGGMQAYFWVGAEIVLKNCGM